MSNKHNILTQPQNDPKIDDLILQKARDECWAFCRFMNEDFFSQRWEVLRPIADTFQYLIQWDRPEVDKWLLDFIKERIKASRFVKKFTENPEDCEASMSPRAGKSYTLSICCSWALGKYSTESILRVSHSQRLYNKFSRNVRYFITTDKFQRVFPGIQLSDDNTEIAGWSLNNSKQGAYFGSGVSGAIVGFGASLVAITDDLYKSYADAMSEAINDTTLEFMESAFDSRKEGSCKQFDIGTRWSIGDYIGQKIENDDYDIVIKIPALDENGNTFCESVKTTEKYNKIKDRLIRNGHEHIWLAEYQQEPIEIKGLLFPKEKLLRFKMADLNMDNCIGKIAFIDTADEGSDFYSAPVGYIFPKDDFVEVYVAKCIFTKEPFKYTQPAQIGMINDLEIDYTFIETNKEGSLYVNNISAACPKYKVIGLRSHGNKETRILMQAGYIVDLFYFLEDDEQDPQYAAFFEALTSYLKEGSKKDDAADSTAGLSHAIRKMFKLMIDKKTKADDTDKQIDEGMHQL